MRFGKTLRGIVAGSLLLGSVAMTASPAIADDDDRFGAYIYAGTADAITDARVIEDIGDLERDDDDDAVQAWSLLGNGQEMPDEFWFEDDDFDDDDDVTLDGLLAEPHLVVIHETEDTGSPIVAMGTIEGTIDADGALLIQLEEIDGSGYEARAWFGPEHLNDDDDNDDDDLDVVVGLYPSGAVEPLGTPEANG